MIKNMFILAALIITNLTLTNVLIYSPEPTYYDISVKFNNAPPSISRGEISKDKPLNVSEILNMYPNQDIDITVNAAPPYTPLQGQPHKK